mgnify:CR=1 FL=1
MHSKNTKAVLLLSDGTVFHGKSCGKIGTTTGEIAFNTGMTGYQEIFTDPSYYGQIITMANAHIGNYGANELEIENKDVGRIKVAKNLINSNFFPSSANNANDNLATKEEDKNEKKDLSNAISSPMVGTIYLKPDPESKPFVSEGDKVKKGDTLLIIEAMKTMNNIPADKDGVIKKVLVENEQPIQFGDPLVIIE